MARERISLTVCGGFMIVQIIWNKIKEEKIPIQLPLILLSGLVKYPETKINRGISTIKATCRTVLINKVPPPRRFIQWIRITIKTKMVLTESRYVSLSLTIPQN